MTTLSHGRVFRIAGPIVLSNATVPLLGAVDTAVIGQLGQAAPLGAVGIGAVILATLYWAFGFLRMSTSGLAAQAQGAGDMAERSAILIRALIIGGTAGLALVVAQVLLFTGAFAVAPASAEVEGLARQYLAIRIWGAPATIGLYALTGWLIGLERTKGVLILQLWQNGLNIGLDLWFVIGLGWGVPGVAAATLIAEWTGLMLGLWLARDAFGPVLRAALARLPDPVALRLMFTASRDIMARTVILQLSFTSFVFLGARFGDVTLAANQVLMQFLEITAYALDGFAFAAEALIGQAVGARSAVESRRAGLLCMQWGFGGAAVLAGVFLLAGPQVIDLMTTAPEVREAARHYLPWLIAAPLIGVAAWIYDGIFIGAMLTGDMLRAMLVSVAVYVVALAVMIPAFGNHGLWAALMVLNATRTVTLWQRYPKVAARAGG
ncbi:MATE family efflux transporter [Tabrizicola sp. BL-A-41-H6]|uniref:MATE family efflux transporter n=1 Tax=Tabrizicola sp. BL-A-41-H6 TaxID=3421107 RepID=UPI003D66C775